MACRAEHLADGCLYYCTLDAGHIPANEHQTEHMVGSPPEDPVTYTVVVYSWTDPAGG